MTPVIIHYEGLDATPIVGMALRARAEGIEEGSFPDVGLHWSYNGIGAWVDGELAGIIVWHEEKSNKRLWLQQGYVAPAWRGKGIYSHLWNALVEKARELKQPSIGSGTRFNNDRMRAVAKKQGRRETSVILEFDVPPVSS